MSQYGKKKDQTLEGFHQYNSVNDLPGCGRSPVINKIKSQGKFGSLVVIRNDIAASPNNF